MNEATPVRLETSYLATLDLLSRASPVWENILNIKMKIKIFIPASMKISEGLNISHEIFAVWAKIETWTQLIWQLII